MKIQFNLDLDYILLYLRIDIVHLYHVCYTIIFDIDIYRCINTHIYIIVFCDGGQTTFHIWNYFKVRKK